MKINLGKTKMMVFNPSTSLNFSPHFLVENKEIEVITEFKLLGLYISNDMKWKSNTMHMVQKASKRLWILRRLKNLGAQSNSLLEVYTKQIRSILEFGVPVWQGSITLAEKTDIERVQKCALHIILGTEYSSYRDALHTLKMNTLEERRTNLCLKFALKCEAHPKFRNWFQLTNNTYQTRRKTKYKVIHANHSRYITSPLGYLTKLLNKHYSS